jgi:hypothetical protein
MDNKTYLELFLAAEDLPGGMRMTQDSRMSGVDSSDSAFPQYRGEHTGFAVWIGQNNAPIWRMVDIRWVFPTEADAAAYHQATLQVNSEGDPSISEALPSGSDCYVFGGSIPDPLFGLVLTRFFYIFRVGRVLVKLYVAEGDEVVQQDRKLTTQMVKQIADRIVNRINNGPRESSNSPKATGWRRWFS